MGLSAQIKLDFRVAATGSVVWAKLAMPEVINPVRLPEPLVIANARLMSEVQMLVFRYYVSIPFVVVCVFGTDNKIGS